MYSPWTGVDTCHTPDAPHPVEIVTALIGNGEGSLYSISNVLSAMVKPVPTFTFPPFHVIQNDL